MWVSFQGTLPYTSLGFVAPCMVTYRVYFGIYRQLVRTFFMGILSTRSHVFISRRPLNELFPMLPD